MPTAKLPCRQEGLLLGYSLAKVLGESGCEAGCVLPRLPLFSPIPLAFSLSTALLPAHVAPSLHNRISRNWHGQNESGVSVAL